MRTLKELKEDMLSLREKFPYETRYFEPWIDEMLSLPEEYDIFHVYEEWAIPYLTNDGTPVYTLLTYALFKH